MHNMRNLKETNWGIYSTHWGDGPSRRPAGHVLYAFDHPIDLFFRECRRTAYRLRLLQWMCIPLEVTVDGRQVAV